jgi:hypothetical protein
VDHDPFYDGVEHGWKPDHPQRAWSRAAEDEALVRAGPPAGLGPGRDGADLLLRYALALPVHLARPDGDLELVLEARARATAYAQGLAKPRHSHPPTGDFGRALELVAAAAAALLAPAQQELAERTPAYEEWRAVRDARWEARMRGA